VPPCGVLKHARRQLEGTRFDERIQNGDGGGVRVGEPSVAGRRIAGGNAPSQPAKAASRLQDLDHLARFTDEEIERTRPRPRACNCRLHVRSAARRAGDRSDRPIAFVDDPKAGSGSLDVQQSGKDVEVIAPRVTENDQRPVLDQGVQKTRLTR
jgi:hypothetical protein